MKSFSRRSIGLLLTHISRAPCTFPPIRSPKSLRQARRYNKPAMAHTYEDALARLASLQSNFAITSLFSPQVSAPAGSQAQDLNAVAIPEVVAWMARAGLAPADLAGAGLRCVHVAGTKGKGSVCAYLTSVLAQPELRPAAGRVGTYTSPHLVSVRERIMLDGAPISRDLFARYFFEVWDAMTASARAEYRRQLGEDDTEEGGKITDDVEAELQGPATKPFYFRFLTILALHAFLREGVRTAVVECGIGGEYDSTNILPADAVTASVVAQLGIDHVGMLGGTLPEIAWHKIGVAKAGRKTFTRRLAGDAGEEAMRVMRDRARDKGAELVALTEAEIEELDALPVRDDDSATSLAGDFQKYNRALAAAAVPEHLRLCCGSDEALYQSVSGETLARAMRRGLEQARLRGRCETREDGGGGVTWLIDGAHTADSLREVAKWFAGRAGSHGGGGTRKVLVFNQQERDVGKLLENLCAGIPSESAATGVSPFDEVIFTRNDLQPRKEDESERDLSVQQTAAEAFKRMYQGSEATIHDNVANAIGQVRNHGAGSQQKTLVLVTGSLHLVGALLQVLEPDAPR